MKTTAEPGYRLVQLPSGVFSIRAVAERETFHPVIGPAAEAETLYVRQLALPDRIRNHDVEFQVWDVGLGAAANALTLVRATKSIACGLRVLSFDRTTEPLRFALDHAKALGYFAGYETVTRELLDRGRVNIEEGPRRLVWELHVCDFPSLVQSHSALGLNAPHAIMFDPFSPARNPEMWTLRLFENLFLLLDSSRPCALATYSRSTMLRVSLLLAGFYVGTGQASGEKEETTIATNTPDLIARPLDRRWLTRARRSTSAEPLREPLYRQAPITAETWEGLLAHPQFRAC